MAEYGPVLEGISDDELTHLHKFGIQYVMKWRGNENTAEDIVQEALLKVLKTKKFVLRGERFPIQQAYFFQALKHTIINTYRKHSRREENETFMPDWNNGDHPALEVKSSFVEDIINKDSCEKATDYINANLSRKQATAFLLFEREDMTYREIAENMEIPIGSVMSNLHRARERLKNSPLVA